MKNQLEKVSKFHTKFNITNNYYPTLIGKQGWNLRSQLAVEEIEEYEIACQKEDLVEIADALGDQLYILLGTILRHGMGDIIEDVFNEIHTSNMSKLDKEGNAIIREDGKILKGELYKRPNLKPIVSNGSK